MVVVADDLTGTAEQCSFFMVGERGHKLFCEHQRHKPARGGGGWRYKARFVFALLLCDFLHSEKIFVIFCAVFFSSLRISALLCQHSLISSVAANWFGN